MAFELGIGAATNGCREVRVTVICDECGGEYFVRASVGGRNGNNIVDAP